MTQIGNSIVTSASLTPEFAEVIKEYNLSPTEVMRKGIAVSLYDLGVSKYQTVLNRHRSEFVARFFNDIKQGEKQSEQFQVLLNFAREIIKIDTEQNDNQM